MTELNNGSYWLNLTSEAKTMIGDALWNTGSNGNSNHVNIITTDFYKLERSNNTGKICSGGGYCNDAVERTTIWIGKIGLMYPSDYGFATGGSTRNTCLNSVLYNWNTDSNCYNNDWIYNSTQDQWTMMPLAHLSYGSVVFGIRNSGFVRNISAYDTLAIRPTLYLSSNVMITGGSGTSSDPYTLGLQ